MFSHQPEFNIPHFTSHCSKSSIATCKKYQKSKKWQHNKKYGSLPGHQKDLDLPLLNYYYYG
jgi:hypothetical protein